MSGPFGAFDTVSVSSCMCVGGGTRLEIFGTEVECHALSKIREALVHTATHTRDDLDAMTVRELKQLARNMFTVVRAY
eukprot:COSAG05_NODE_806_length_7193_cov_10.079786_4_plen_78_part_00